MKSKKKYNYVNYLWDEKKASSLKNNQVELFLYRSNILGADLRITNFGGGNTSCKTIEKDPITNEKVEVMWIKGSGGDIGSLNKNGIAGLYTKKIKDLKKVYRGLKHEDEMVELFNHCIYDLNSRTPSIDTPLHGLLPFKHIDHLHPDAVISIAANKDSQKITKQIWGNTIGWIEWQRPGFDLGLKLEKCLKENPGIIGIILENHGLFTWGETSYECYINSLEVIEKASKFIADKIIVNGPAFGGKKIDIIDEKERKSQAAKISPILRGLCSSSKRMIGHFNDCKAVLEFINSYDMRKLAAMGTSCPDHFLRTKIRPLIINLSYKEDLTDYTVIINKLNPLFEKYRDDYLQYYNSCKKDDSPTMRDPNPVIILYPGIGMFSFAKNKQTARVASEFYINAINVMKGAEAISKYISLPLQEAFDIEYWLLEENKLQRQPKEKILSRKVALITGSGGGIGRAIAEKLIKEGANVIFTDISEKNLKDTLTNYNKDQAISCICDVVDEKSIGNVIEKACIAFGGIDIVIHSAGFAISKSISNTTNLDWDSLQDVLVKGQFLISKKGASIMKKQKLGGNIVNIASKNGLVSRPNNIGYSTAKAAQIHMSRLLAAELATYKIRVNTVNPDGVIIGSNIWKGKWAKERAKSFGIKIDELPNYYAKKNLLNQVIKPEDIANGVFVFIAILDKSTGNILNVDGGLTDAFVR